ncbi:hypothetical protein ACFOLM_22325 [Deinococcus soli (ex Cha et al. 2016)]|uniref:hypothetical protein n=1 Tax=Deinococcus soli (ex Cha et al. 2016) TaxID=1309411 RepID=UPI0036060585
MNHHDLANAAQLAELQEWVAAAVGAGHPQPVRRCENQSSAEIGEISDLAVSDVVTSSPDHL